MKLYDISQEILEGAVYPGDPVPEKKLLSSMEEGDLYNLTAFSMCAHNATHVDAPRHFLADGKTVDRLPLSKTVGDAVVVSCSGVLDEQGAKEVLALAEALGGQVVRRLLLKGNAVVTPEAAEIFALYGLDLLGTELQSVGAIDAPMAAHLALLSREVVLLEGVRLREVAEGRYFLCAAPLLLGGSDGAPCRALLIDFSKK